MANERKNNIFKQVPISRVKRNMFDLSHEVKMSGKFGLLYPVLCMDTLPGDTIRDAMNVMVRFAPMLAPIMHRIDVTTHFFFVPNRIITDHWEDFITGGKDGLAAPVLPYVTPNQMKTVGAINALKKGSLWDYLGLPVLEGAEPPFLSDNQISVLPFRAVAKIYNDYYRDPNLSDEMELNKELEGEVSLETEAAGLWYLSRYRRGFEKDYFTSALPWAQRGAQVLMPLSGIGEITYKDPNVLIERSTGLPYAPGSPTALQSSNTGEFEAAGGADLLLDNIESVSIDNASTTINDFRRAVAIQRWLENNARGGARYTEQILGHFNVQVPDYRLQRAEYIGGGKQPVQISEVLTTAKDEVNESFVGDMAGHGLSVGRTNRFTYRCQEHGFIVGLLSVTMRTAYSQGIPRMFTRADKFDYAWPELANLGEQEIKSKEVFFDFTNGQEEENDSLFGYTPRYSEYKFQNDRIAGDFRDNLGFWHLGRRFVMRPSLDNNFTSIDEDGTGMEETFRRIFAVQDGTDYLWMQLYHHLTAKRPLPYFGVPQII